MALTRRFESLSAVSFETAVRDELGVRWDDVRAPATAVRVPGVAGDPDYDSTNLGYLFDGAATETIQVIMQLPHSYMEGTSVHPHIHWEPTTTDSGNVYWQLEWRWRNNGETAGAFSAIALIAEVSGTADKLQIDGFGGIDKDDAKISSILEFKLSRLGDDASDTYNSKDARLKEFDIHFRVDGSGSRQEYRKT